MAPDRASVDSRWWYATVGTVVLLLLYVTQSPPDASLILLGLNVAIVLATTLCLSMDIRAIRRSELSWDPSSLYVLGALFTPILLFYGYRRYRHVGLI
jgi:hypothetical protein